MNSFVLKVIACVTMFIDHIGYAMFDGHASWLNYIGRLAFPIFAFQISEGYIHTHNMKKYIFRLAIFALVSQIPFMFFHSIINTDFGLNVIFTLLLGLISIFIYDKSNKFVGIITPIILAVISEVLHCDYGIYGVAIVFLFYVFRQSKWLTAISFIVATIIKYGYSIFSWCSRNGFEYFDYVFEYYYPYILCTLASIIIILLYNKKKGLNTKFFLYIFYPLHLILIYGINMLGII